MSQDLIMGLLSVVAGVMGWVIRQLWDAVQDLRKVHAEFQARIPLEYVRYDRLESIMQPIKEALDDIKETLRGKADRP